MVFRVNKTKDFTVMSNYHLREKDMSLKAKGLLSWMLSNTDDWDYSIQGIVANCKENETAIESALNELKQFGYLTVTKLTPDKTESGRYEYIYDIHEKPEQGVEKQGVEILPLEIQGVENPVQRNTIEISTNERNTKEENIILKNNTDQGLPLVNNDIVNTPLVNNKRKIPNININDDIQSKSFSDDLDKPKPKKLNLYQKMMLEIEKRYSENPDLSNILKDYVNIRLNIKDKPIRGIGQWTAMLDTLDGLSGDKVAIVKRAIERGWAAFFDIKDYTYNKRGGTGYANSGGVTDYSVFGETEEIAHGSVRPETVEGGGFSGHVF